MDALTHDILLAALLPTVLRDLIAPIPLLPIANSPLAGSTGQVRTQYPVWMPIAEVHRTRVVDHSEGPQIIAVPIYAPPSPRQAKSDKPPKDEPQADIRPRFYVLYQYCLIIFYQRHEGIDPLNLLIREMLLLQRLHL